LWSDLVESFAEEGVMFEDVCEDRPASFALLMYGSKLKEEYTKKLKDLKEPCPIQHTTWRTWQTHADILSTNEQEDSSEFLTILFDALYIECQDHEKMHLSLRSHFFFQCTPQYQCQICKKYSETETQPSNMIQLSLSNTEKGTSIQSLLNRTLNKPNVSFDNQNQPSCSHDNVSHLPCTTCKEAETNHSSWEELSDLPNYLFLCLKRYNENGGKVARNISCDSSLMIPEVVTKGEFLFKKVIIVDIYLFTH
jgi:hypothetical protein